MPSSWQFYVTTPIYYGNGIPHVGHFYTSLIANIIYKYHKVSWYDARFTTWIDENSQKAVIEAEKAGLDIMEYLDAMAQKHRSVWNHFNFDYTDFIRTTESRHTELVQKVLQHCFDKGDIYEWVYEGKYCIGCEGFKKDDDLIEKDGKLVCPDHLTEPDEIEEKNYFFRLSKYQTWMEEFYAAHPEFVIPNFRFNEVKAFVERWLEDFSISRETNTFGIELPFDTSQVTYVWFDALFNYYTSCVSSRGWDKENQNFVDESSFWPANLHIVGKDIIRFHAIFWPAMLASYFDLWEEKGGVLHFVESDREKLPKQILTGGFFTVDGQKMSKTLGNVIEPVAYSKTYSKELLTLYMLNAFPIGNDGDYDREEAIKLYNAKLANNFGNLVNRVVVLTLKLASPSLSISEKDANSKFFLGENGEKYRELFFKYNLKWVLDNAFDYLDILNKYADEKEPWKLIKTDEKKASEVLAVLAEWLRQVGLCLYPFFPEKMSEMFEKIGLEWYGEKLEKWQLQILLDKKEIFNIKERWNPLFQRIDVW